ncbi:MAG: hypothetical protein WCB27_02125 [Thermoguttaceae bacterium]
MTPSALLPGWLVFERLQHSIDARILNADALGAEEALADLLDDFANGFTPTAEYVKRRFRSLRQNRSRKHRHRFALASATARSEHVAEDTGRVDDADQLRFVKDHVTPDEWALLQHVAAGDTCDDTARTTTASAGQVRTRLCRLRSRLRTRRSAPPTM